MIRAVFFDFYGVWTPDKLSELISEAEKKFGYGSDATADLVLLVERYYRGEADINEVADTFRFKLSRPDIDAQALSLSEADITPAVADFMRGLHAHFVKVGVLANLGNQELQLLRQFNDRNQAFEVIGGPLAFNSASPLLSQQIFAQALQAIGEPPASCLVVSSNPAYLSFAESLNITPLKFEGFPKLSQSLEQMVS
jgi:FMN phosphatase YigB (HAD superfamily)